MKKFFALLALVLGVVSCQTEGFDVNVGGEQDVNITVSLPEGTRANSALGAFDNVDMTQYDIRYIFQVFNAEGTVYKTKQVICSDDTTVSFPVRLIPNRTYNFVVWADLVKNGETENAHYTIGESLENIALNVWAPMDESRDAYTGKTSALFNGDPIKVTLTRPFSKLRVVTTDMAELMGVVPTEAKVVYTTKHYDRFNAFAQVPENKELNDKTHETFDIVSYESVNSKTKTLFTDYFFATESQEVVKFTLEVIDGNDVRIVERAFNTDIPVKRNYVTTIQGDILTMGDNITVEVLPGFENGSEWNPAEDEYDVEIFAGHYDDTIVLSKGIYIFNDVTVNTENENAVIVAENAEVTVDVIGFAKLQSAGKAIYVPASSTLTINGVSKTRSNQQNGELFVVGGNGADSDVNGSAIAVDGKLFINDIASLTAKGYGKCGYGIGGINGEIVIENTTIDYVSGGYVQPLFISDLKYGKSEPEGAAAIGGKKIVINNSVITKAEGGSKAAAIGNRYWESAEVVITDSWLGDIFGGNASAAIGGSRYSSDKATHHEVKVTIDNSTIVNAVGGQYGAGIGSGYDTHCQAGGEGSIAENEIVIKESTITAQGGKYAAGIGTGFHAAALAGSIDAASTINATAGERFYKGTYTYAQHIGYGVVDPAREYLNEVVEFKVDNEVIEEPSVYAGVNEVRNVDEFQTALNGVKAGDNLIVFVENIEGDVTIVEKPSVKIIINGCDCKYVGSIKIHSNSEHYADAAVTIKNVNFETATASVNFVEALENGSERYSTNITVEECTFTATGEAVNTSVGVQIKSSKNAKVLNCTATDMHSLIQAQSCDETVVVKDCVVEGKNGVAFKQVKAATVEGTTIVAKEYGIRFDGNTDNYGIIVKNNNVTAYQPLIVRKMTGQNNTITLEGTNTLTPTTEGDYQIVITNGSDDAEYVEPTGTYTLTGADSYKLYPVKPVAKVGSVEYYDIDEAIAAWTNNATLTLMADVTLNDVVMLNSTEHHILNLGTYTMTAADGKNAFEIVARGTGASERTAITIKADATTPGAIKAGSKSVVYYDYAKGTATGDDRPIIKIEGGVFYGSTSSWGTAGIYFKGGSAARHAATLNISGGEFYCSINGQSKSKLLISGGLFHYSVGSQGDSTALRLISGGTFKTLGFMTADSNNTKFWFGTSMGNSNVGLYINDDNYLVVGGPVITEFGDKFAAKATNATKWSSYLQYSSAAANGLYYTNAEMAIKKHGEANVELK